MKKLLNGCIVAVFFATLIQPSFGSKSTEKTSMQRYRERVQEQEKNRFLEIYDNSQITDAQQRLYNELIAQVVFWDYKIAAIMNSDTVATQQQLNDIRNFQKYRLQNMQNKKRLLTGQGLNLQELNNQLDVLETSLKSFNKKYAA
ncbi:MAG: hypothetical protein CL947_00035 [Epsilonproteobacteria bacterium]|nr:hypothetical protein [Campylobacterota bacterium]|tara:strand:+ start:1992 stop:2426 length:435 start_codon:yes stop_codon:yes gene_type:complete